MSNDLKVVAGLPLATAAFCNQSAADQGTQSSGRGAPGLAPCTRRTGLGMEPPDHSNRLASERAVQWESAPRHVWARTPPLSHFRLRLREARSDSMRPAMERICAGDALPVRSALPARLASCLLGGLSGVDFLAMRHLLFLAPPN
jgi:hypothetical protein